MTQSTPNSQQIIASIINHRSFASISQTLNTIEQYHGKIPTADLPFVELQLLQMHHNLSNDQLRRNKLSAAIEKLQEIIEFVEEESEILFNKLKWTRQQTAFIENSREDIQSEIDILQSFPRVKGKQQRSQYHGDSHSQLKQILEFYQCRQFPRNKTEALMLVNQIECKIQQIELSKAAQFQFHS